MLAHRPGLNSICLMRQSASDYIHQDPNLLNDLAHKPIISNVSIFFRNLVCNFIRDNKSACSAFAAYQFRRRYGCTRWFRWTRHIGRIRYVAVEVILSHFIQTGLTRSLIVVPILLVPLTMDSTDKRPKPNLSKIWGMLYQVNRMSIIRFMQSRQIPASGAKTESTVRFHSAFLTFHALYS